MNELLWFATFILDFGLLLLLYKYLGRIGLLAWIPMATILANIQVIKTVQLFGMTATLGNVAYASIFLATDILSENYGKRDATIAVWLGFFSMLASIAIMCPAIAFVPNNSDFAQDSLKTIFTVMPRIASASIIAYIISQFHDIWSYHLWKSKLPDVRFLWVRNNISTLVSQFLDSAVFTTIAFLGVFPMNVFWSIMLTTYLLKAMTALLDTPCIYLASWLFRNGKVREG